MIHFRVCKNAVCDRFGGSVARGWWRFVRKARVRMAQTVLGCKVEMRRLRVCRNRKTETLIRIGMEACSIPYVCKSNKQCANLNGNRTLRATARRSSIEMYFLRNCGIVQLLQVSCWRAWLRLFAPLTETVHHCAQTGCFPAVKFFETKTAPRHARTTVAQTAFSLFLRPPQSTSRGERANSEISWNFVQKQPFVPHVIQYASVRSFHRFCFKKKETASLKPWPTKWRCLARTAWPSMNGELSFSQLSPLWVRST